MSCREIEGGKKGNTAGCEAYTGNQPTQPSCDFCKAERLGTHYKACVSEEPVANPKRSHLWHGALRVLASGCGKHLPYYILGIRK